MLLCKKELPNSTSTADNQRMLFDRFSQGLLDKSTFSYLDPEEKVELREKGWEAYRED